MPNLICRLLPEGALTVGIAVKVEAQNILTDETISVYTWEHTRQHFKYFASMFLLVPLSNPCLLSLFHSSDLQEMKRKRKAGEGSNGKESECLTTVLYAETFLL